MKIREQFKVIFVICWLWICFGFYLVVSVAGCCGRDPDYSEPMINGWLYRGEYYDNTVEYERYVEVFDPKGLRMVPVVSLNKESLPAFYYSWTKYAYKDSNQFMVNQPYELKVEHFWGKASARVTMPGNFSIHRPREGYILDLDSTLYISWSKSAGAQWYFAEIDIEYNYRGTNGEDDDQIFQLDTLLTDTLLVIPSERIFPAFVADVYEGDGCVVVWSGNGPAIEPGDKGNIQGSGFGFFNAINEPREKYFYVGAPISLRRCSDMQAVRDRMKALLLKRQ